MPAPPPLGAGSAPEGGVGVNTLALGFSAKALALGFSVDFLGLAALPGLGVAGRSPQRAPGQPRPGAWRPPGPPLLPGSMAPPGGGTPPRPHPGCTRESWKGPETTGCWPGRSGVVCPDDLAAAQTQGQTRSTAQVRSRTAPSELKGQVHRTPAQEEVQAQCTVLGLEIAVSKHV